MLHTAINVGRVGLKLVGVPRIRIFEGLSVVIGRAELFPWLCLPHILRPVTMKVLEDTYGSWVPLSPPWRQTGSPIVLYAAPAPHYLSTNTTSSDHSDVASQCYSLFLNNTRCIRPHNCAGRLVPCLAQWVAAYTGTHYFFNGHIHLLSPVPCSPIEQKSCTFRLTCCILPGLARVFGGPGSKRSGCIRCGCGRGATLPSRDCFGW